MSSSSSLGPPRQLILHDIFPNLKGATQDNPNFDLYEYLGEDNWCIFFCHPGDYTPVCTTELGEAAHRSSAFKQRHVKLCGFSCNDAESHRGWIKDIKAATGATVDFPLLCDPDRTVSTALGLLDPENLNAKGLPLTVRSVFVIHPNKKIDLVMTYPASCGRSFDEIFRVVESLQRTDVRRVCTPSDWHPGQDVIVDFGLSNADAQHHFDGYKTVVVPSEAGKTDLVKNYLRTTPDRWFDINMYNPEMDHINVNEDPERAKGVIAYDHNKRSKSWFGFGTSKSSESL